MRRRLALLLWLASLPAQALELADIGYAPRPGAQLPADIALTDAAGRAFTTGELYGTRPTVLMLGYFHCPRLCGAVWAGMASAFARIDPKPGEDFEVLVASIDPGETPAQAAARQRALRDRFPQAGVARWRFATAAPAQIERLAQAVGFSYRYDAPRQQFAHAAGIVVLDARGRIARYLAGVQFQPRNLELGLIDAGRARPGTGLLRAFAGQARLLCYHYDPVTGRYSARIVTILQAGCAGSVLALGGLLLWLRRREHREPRP